MLTLPTKKQWYDAILAGNKKIEYREINPYWTNSFLKELGIEGSSDESKSSLIKKIKRQKKHFDVKIICEFEQDSPSFIAECWVDIGPDRYGEYCYKLHIVEIKHEKEELLTDQNKKFASVRENEGKKVIDTTDKTRRLYEFIKEMCLLSSKAVVDIKNQRWVKEVEEIPYYDDYVSLHYFDSIEESDNDNNENTILCVRKPEYSQCPVPSELFASWLIKGWSDFTRTVEVRDYISNKKIDSKTRTEYEEKEFFTDSQERVEEYEKWYKERAEWAEEQNQIDSVRKLFTELYTLHSDLERDSETIELMCGTGFIKVKKRPEINHPILLHKMTTRFDPEANELRIVDVDSDSEFYSSPLNGVEGLNLQGIQEDILNGSFHPMDRENTPDYLKVMSHKMSSECKFADSEADSDFGRNDEFVLSSHIVFFVRKRIDGTSRAIGLILENILETGYIPSFIQEIVSGGECQKPIENTEKTIEQQLAEVGGEDVDILLSKEANREQLEIARRIEEHNAVLVQGPPGTGKTHTIANLLGHFLAEGKSILVTSYTKKALSVLKDKVSPGLQNLCVSVLDDSREDMERAVEGITEYTSKNNSFILKRKIDHASTERSRIIDELAAVRRKLYSIKFQECNTIVLNGESISPTKAAQFVAENADQLDYIPGRVESGYALPLSLEELTRLYYSNSLITQEDEIELNCNIPSRDEIPSTEDVRSLHEKLENASERLKAVCLDRGYEPTIEDVTGELFIKGSQGEFSIPEYGTVNTEELKGLIEKLPTFEEWMIYTAIDGKRGGVYKSRWQLLIEKIKATEVMSEAFIGERFGKEIYFNEPVKAEEAYHIYAQMKEQYETKGNIKTLGIFMPKPFSMALEYVVINGKKISCADDCSLILKEIDLRKAREECSRFWNELLVSHGAPDFMSLDSNEPEREAMKWIPIIENALELYTSFYQEVQIALDKINLPVKELFAIGQTESDDIQTRKIITGITRTLPEVIKIITCEQEIAESKRDLNQMLSVFSQDERRSSAICQKAIKAISRANAEEYLPIYNKICNLYDKYELQREREISLRKLEVIAPDWAVSIRRRKDIHGHADVPSRILDAWKWKQYVIKLDELSGESFEELQRKSSRLSRQYRECTATLAELKAWYHLTMRTESDLTLKQNLQGWAQTVRRIGKGTGKSAPKYRAEARRLMAKCQRAVPAWIMPMNKAIETLDPKNNRFDIVIIDEASQSDLSAFAVAYMAQKIIVVGDDRQVSPMAIGVKDEELNSLASMYIKDIIPNWVLYNSKTSLYDIAQTTFPALMLKEHFRCVPDIIGFSNWLSYDGQIKVLRDDSDSELLPATINYRVRDGERTSTNKKTNEAEAKTIVCLMKACMENQAYTEKTFGVISLLGDEQVKLIQRYMYQHIGEKELDKRKVLCGNSANFQGDERDVIFLSMIDSSGEDGPLRLMENGSDDSIKKRYNVAVSRARDQLWVVNSLDPDNDLKEKDIRRRLLRYASNPKEYSQRLSVIEQDSESPFELEIATALVTRGYNVHQQWKVGSYRIDMVVEYCKKRIAVECDGERFHSGEEHIRADMERQTILERIGWHFIRIRGSEYYRNKQAVIEKLVRSLNEYGIYPEQGRRTVTEKSITSLQQAIYARAEELMDQWFPKPVTDDSLDTAEHIISYIPDYSHKSSNVIRQRKTNEKKNVRPKKAYDRQTAGQLSLSDLYGWNYGKK